ncbi:MAG: tRNA adenosine(34) deaminase TadA [Actinomycetota bacterium]|nr:tRNA adenosine(34) deaminase TadA [Actinomycetota bacterium]
MPSDESFMRIALDQARIAFEHGDVPVGAVLVRGDEVLAKACNERELRGDPTAHAEILALQAGSLVLGTWRLDDTTLYVTLEPCPMCAGALVWGRVGRLVYGPQDPKAGAALSLYNIPQDPRLNHHVSITTDVLAAECSTALTEFFALRRL